MAVQLAEHESFRDIIQERIEPTDADLESDDSLDAWMKREVSTAQHISCTCKMGPSSDPLAVADQYGRVHGLEGVRVADASVMPRIVSVNTNAATIMIAEKAADLIRQAQR